MMAVKDILNGRIFGVVLITALCFEGWMLFSLSCPTEGEQGWFRIPLSRHQLGKLRIGGKLPPLNNLKYLSGKDKEVKIDANGAWLIFTSDCTGCSAPWLDNVQLWQKENSNFSCYVILRPAEGMKESPPKHLSHLSFFLDADGSTCQAMDVFFLPRLYVVGSDGRMRYLQPSDVRITDALEYAQRLTKAGGAKS